MIRDTNQNNSTQHKSRPLVDMLISIVIPSLILMNLSDDENLGASMALVLALAFPLGWGLFEFIRYQKTNFIAILGLVSVLLTGGIGLLQLDVEWLAVKEAAIPAIIGIAVLISTRTQYPLVRTLLYNPTFMEVEKIQQKLDEEGSRSEFEDRLMSVTYWLSGTFFFSAFMNYVLAKWVVISPAGSTAFNEELGRMTLLSYPVIAIPSMFMMMGIMYYLWRTIRTMTGMSLEEIMVLQETGESK